MNKIQVMVKWCTSLTGLPVPQQTGRQRQESRAGVVVSSSHLLLHSAYFKTLVLCFNKLIRDIVCYVYCYVPLTLHGARPQKLQINKKMADGLYRSTIFVYCICVMSIYMADKEISVPKGSTSADVKLRWTLRLFPLILCSIFGRTLNWLVFFCLGCLKLRQKKESKQFSDQVFLLRFREETEIA